MPQDVKSHDNQTPGNEKSEPESLQGLVADASDERALLDALEDAFDYRGDVTITKTSGETVEGYIFDRRRGGGLTDSIVRMMGPGSDAYITVRFDEIARLNFSGKDTAHGKSFERWVERYTEKKLKEARGE